MTSAREPPLPGGSGLTWASLAASSRTSVVEDEAHVPLGEDGAQESGAHPDGGRDPLVRDAESGQQGVERGGGAGVGPGATQIGEETTVGEPVGRRVPHPQSQGGLADAGWPGYQDGRRCRAVSRVRSSATSSARPLKSLGAGGRSAVVGRTGAVRGAVDAAG
ncbi:hypothetical protein ACH4TP_07105 [Streptomyces sp. NPDC021012]|uniref:hypothetical protein n=1 Tax=Streptomyces sp. NPDC021012 TaxID=3365107 RepID=UPI003798DC72